MSRRIIFSNYDHPMNPYYGGGGAVAIHEIARRLARRHEVQIIAGKYPGSRDGVADGVSYKHIGSASAGPKSGQLLFQLFLPWLVLTKDFDIWIESMTPPFSTACLQLFTKKPVIALTQILGGKAMTKKYSLPFAQVEKIGLKTYHYAIALSAFLKSEIQAASPRTRVAIIPNGISQDQIEQEITKEEEHILFLGRIDVEQKGLDLLLNAYERIAGDTSVPLVLAGSGSPKDEQFVSRRITQSGLQNKIKMIGRVEGASKREAFRRALFLVMPSRFEAFPLTLLEAFCYKLPVVLFGIKELNWLPDTSCLKVTPFDEVALGKAMLGLIHNPDLRRAMGEAAKLLARDFDWENLANKYEDFFESVLEKR